MIPVPLASGSQLTISPRAPRLKMLKIEFQATPKRIRKIYKKKKKNKKDKTKKKLKAKKLFKKYLRRELSPLTGAF